jgi:DNA-binding SARP family transcriptional activator/ABC-type branched-subunit amino acid transport system substrate-binding protein
MRGNDVEFRILGSLAVADRGEELELGAAKQRALLGLLLLHRNEAVPSERLVDLLWNGAPPATAQKSLQVYVSGLRKVLGDGRIETRGRAYLLHVGPGELDLDRFEALLEQAGDAEAPARAGVLREALALFRGEPLADLRYEAFAQTEIARLDELRLQTLEDRIDADLACGNERPLIGELEGLVAAHPLRERLRGQLMLALYRTGRQADALASYREGRELLDRELGLEPGPELKRIERQILEQDPALAPQRRSPLALRRPASRRALAGVAAAGALIVAAAVAAAIVETGRGGAEVVTAAGSSVAAVDPRSGKVVGDFPVGSTPTAVSVGRGAVWVLNADDETVSRIDPHGGAVKTFATGATPIDLAAGPGGVWVGTGVRRAASVLPVLTAVSSLDPTHVGSVLRKTALPAGSPYLPEIAVGRRVVWAVSRDNQVVRIDPRNGRTAVRVRSSPVFALAVGPDESLWALTLDGRVIRIDRRTNRVSFTIKPAASTLSDLAVGAGAVWVSDPYDGTIWRIDPGTKPVTRTIPVPSGTDQVAFGAGALWTVDSVGGTLSKIDPRSNRVTRTISIGNTPRGVAVGEGHVWVSVAGAGDTALPAAFRSKAASIALPSSACGDLVYGGAGQPQYVIASDFPLHAGPRAPTLAMSQAVEFVLRQHHFRAGKYRVASQSCDDSTAQSGNYDLGKCTGNMKLIAANPHVLGVIGPYNSGCAEWEIPIANRGSVPMVSPATSISALTRAPPGTRAPVDDLYPTGRRNFFRVYPANDSEAAALAVLAKQLGAKRVYMLRSAGEEYVDDIAPWFPRAARKLGLVFAGSSTWDPGWKDDHGIAAKVARSHADAVYLAGLLLDGRVAGQIVRRLRAALGERVPLMAGDGFLPISQLVDAAGPAARGMYVSTIGLTLDQLPPAGQAFVKQFASTQPNAQVDPTTAYWAAYTAAATDALLDAIARSDGTRGSVIDMLVATRLQNTAVGKVAFDRNGDSTSRPITIYRAQRAGGSIQFMAVQGATLDRVIYVPQRLTR